MIPRGHDTSSQNLLLFPLTTIANLLPALSHDRRIGHFISKDGAGDEHCGRSTPLFDQGNSTIKLAL
jgi:hypothetical protein